MPVWTTPVDQSTGHVVTATEYNTEIEDDLSFLYGDTGWTNMTSFSGTWAAGGVQPRYMIIGRFVTIQGQISSGTINTAAFTLPSGYRPSENLTFAAAVNPGASATFGAFTVASTGVITPQVGTTTNFCINCTFAVV